MCTSICASRPIRGAGKGRPGWLALTRATVAFDHPARASAEHALLIDFANPQMGPSARLAVELDLASGKALLEQLRSTIEAAEASGAREQPG